MPSPHKGSCNNLRSLKSDKALGNVKFIIHSPTDPTKTQAFYGIRMFFAEYSPVFDELLYDDPIDGDDRKDDEKLFLDSLDDDECEDDGITKVMHINGIAPDGFGGFYDILLGDTKKLDFKSEFMRDHLIGEWFVRS